MKGANTMRLLRAGTALLLVAASGPATAFLPITSGIGHGAITNDGFIPVFETIQSEERRFTGAAIAEIVKANVDEDKNQAPERHFDGEEFKASSSRLVVHKLMILTRLEQGDGAGARELLGQALHTLQDYYSHTSHIDAGGPLSTIFNPSLGVETFGPTPGARCSNAFFGDAGPSTTAQTSGYYSLHGILLPGQTYEACSAPDNKCSHGNSLFGSAIAPNCGLNKDSDLRPNHEMAVQLATQSTTAYVRLVLAQIRFELPSSQADVAVCRLMGIANPEVTCMAPIPCESDLQCSGGGLCITGFCMFPRPDSACTVSGGGSVSGCNAGEVCYEGSGQCFRDRPDREVEGLICNGLTISNLAPACADASYPRTFIPLTCSATSQDYARDACIELWGNCENLRPIALGNLTCDRFRIDTLGNTLMQHPR